MRTVLNILPLAEHYARSLLVVPRIVNILSSVLHLARPGPRLDAFLRSIAEDKENAYLLKHVYLIHNQIYKDS